MPNVDDYELCGEQHIVQGIKRLVNGRTEIKWEI